jgi:hypothetical protein
MCSKHIGRELLIFLVQKDTITLKMTYYSYFHSIITYGLIFWGNSPESIKIFRLQKKIIRIMMGWRSRDSCKNCFLTWKSYPSLPNILFPFYCSIIRNKNQFQVNSEIHQINTRQHVNLHQPPVNGTKHQKAIHCTRVKVFNVLPFYIKQSLIIQKNLKHCYKNTYVKIPYIPWMNILNNKLNFDIWSETTHEGFGTHVRSLYLQVCIINMLVYIQPLSVTKENFLLKQYL